MPVNGILGFVSAKIFLIKQIKIIDILNVVNSFKI